MVMTFVLGLDGSPIGEVAAERCTELARACHAHVLAVHAFEPLDLVGRIQPPLDFPRLKTEATQQLAGDWTRCIRDAGVPCDTTLMEGDPTSCLVEAATKASAAMIVVGATGNSLLTRVTLGSTALKLPQVGPCPVLIVPVPRQ
jgi:nucleotide-binding universal stress UspA family protein